MVIAEIKPSISLEGPESLFLKGNNTSEFLTKMKTIPGRRFHASSGTWEVPLAALPHVVELLKGNIRFVDKTKEEVLEMIKSDRLNRYKEYLRNIKPLVEFEFKTQPGGHQIEFFNIMINRDLILLGDDQGLGKSKAVIDVLEYRRLHRGYKKVLIIAKASLKFNWLKEIEKHGRSKAKVLHGQREKRLGQIELYKLMDDFYYLVVGYEQVKIHYDQLKEIPFNAVALDEPTKVVNPRAQVTKANLSLICKEVQPESVILTTGTPHKKRPENLWALLTLLRHERRSYWKFLKDYCVYGGFGGKQIVGYKNLDDLHARLNQVMIRRTKDILDLPEKRYQDIVVRMNPQQAQLYRAVRESIVQELVGNIDFDKVWNVVNPLAKLTRLRQVTTNPALIGSNAPSSKHEVLLDLLEDIVDEGEEKAVIFSIYREETRILRELLDKYNPAYIDGTVPDKKRQEEVDRFQEDKRCKIFIGTVGACKEGFTLTAANHAIFIDLPWVLTDIMQAEDRIHRIGQKKSVNIIRLLCHRTVDQRVIEILEKDRTLFEAVVEGKSKARVQNFVRHLLKDFKRED